jgi:DNA-binding transcriptional regulator YiaG
MMTEDLSLAARAALVDRALAAFGLKSQVELDARMGWPRGYAAKLRHVERLYPVFRRCAEELIAALDAPESIPIRAPVIGAPAARKREFAAHSYSRLRYECAATINPGAITPSELREILAQLNISQAELARRIGVLPPAVSRWLSGRAPLKGPAAALIRLMLDLQVRTP